MKIQIGLNLTSKKFYKFCFLRVFIVGIASGIFLFIFSCDAGLRASKIFENNYITISSPSPINRANMLSYSLRGTCFYNGQPVTVHITGQTGDPLLSPKGSTCTDEKWAVNDLDLSSLSNGDVTLEVIHLDPIGKGYSVKEIVIKSSEGAAVSINKNNLLNITHEASNTYPLTGTCTELGEDVSVEVTDSDETNTLKLSSSSPCEDPNPQDADPLGEWSASFDHSGLSEGTLTVRVTHSSSDISDTIEILKDVTRPTVTISNTGGERVSTETYSMSGTCSEVNGNVEVTLTDTSSPSAKEITQTASCAENSGSGQWEIINFNITTLVDGGITILVTQEDGLGNTGEATLTITKGPEVVGPVEPVVDSGCADTEIRGTGTPADPYLICNVALFEHIRSNSSTSIQFYKLEQDVDFIGTRFEPLGVAKANCGETGAFPYYFDGNGKRIVNYKLPMSIKDYYHPTDRRQDIFGRCTNNVQNLTVSPGSPDQETEFCDLFHFGSNGGDIGLTEAEEQMDGSLALGALILCTANQIHTIDGDINNLSQDYILYKDIDFENVENSASIIDGDYTGTFDGNNKTIRNLMINSSHLKVGFFSSIQQGEVKNLKIENVNIKSTNNTGDRVATSTHQKYNPSCLGVLAGEVREGRVINCSVKDTDSDVDLSYDSSSTGAAVIGGLIGYGLGLDLEGSFSEGLDIKTEHPKARIDIGGLVGHQSVCPNNGDSPDLDCSIESSANIVGKIKHSYTAHQNINVNFNQAANTWISVGGLIGRVSSGEDNTFEIKDSYAWENNVSFPSAAISMNFGGLVGSLDSSFFGQGYPVHAIEPGSLKITNSYTSGGDVHVEEGTSGGILGDHDVESTQEDSFLILENSFSNSPFMNFITTSDSYSRSQIGGLKGSSSIESSLFADFSESYYTGKITCASHSYQDQCGGIVGSIATSIKGVISNIDNFKMTNLYSTAEIQQVAPASRRDNIGLLFSASYQIIESYEIINGMILNDYDPATNGTDNPSLYFRRNGITNIRGRSPGDTSSSTRFALKNISQPCFVLTNTDNEACLGLAVDPEDNITAGNRSLTPAQFQSVPSNPTVATGTSPALGSEFLYTEGWCPRVCRDGSSSCTETSNTLVGFDENGDPLLGPGGGFKAQARNEGRNCFEPCFEFEGNTISAYGCKMRDVTIPEGTTSILAEAFKDKGLTSVTLSNNLQSIGDEAFSGNALAEIIIPSSSSTITIGDNAFSNNPSLTSVCIESQESGVALGTTPFGGLASSSISFESDEDCSN